MRKLTLLFTAMLVSLVSAIGHAETITQNFNDRPAELTMGLYPSGSDPTEVLPTGWYVSGVAANKYYEMTWSANAGIGGTPCLQFKNSTSVNPNSPSSLSYIITLAKAGTVSFKCKNMSLQENSGHFIGIYKMTKNADGSFTPGEKIKEYFPMSSNPAGTNIYGAYVDITAEIPEDMYIGISGNCCYIDDYTNEATASGGEQGGEMVTDTMNFDVVPTGYTDDSMKYGGGGMPENWYLYGDVISYPDYMGWPAAKGMDNSGCIWFKSKENKYSYVVTPVKKGKVTVMVKCPSNGGETFSWTRLSFHKMTVSDTSGKIKVTGVESELKSYKPLSTADVTSTGWTKVEIEIPEDMYLGVSGVDAYIDNFENIYEVATPPAGDIVTETEDFNNRSTANGSSDSGLNAADLPNGWHLSGAASSNMYRMAWPSNQGVDDTPCIKFNANPGFNASNPQPNDAMSFLITSAHAGKVSIMAKATMETYVDDARAYLSLWKMKDNGDGTFTPLEPIKKYDRLKDAGITATEFNLVEFDLPEDCIIGISTLNLLLDNYENSYERATTTTVTSEEDFNNRSTANGSGDFYLNAADLPAGWYLAGLVTSSSSKMSWPEFNGVNGTPCIEFSSNGGFSPSNPQPNDQMSFLVTSAHAGTVSFMAKAKSAFGLDNQSNYISLWKMKKNDDGTFTPVEAIKKYATQREAGVNGDEFTELSFELDEDCYIGISALQLWVDNFRNTYTTSAETYTISGTVTDENNKPVAGATVSIKGCDDVTTGEDGTYSVANVVAAETTITVTAAGYKTFTQSINPTADMQLNVTLEQIESTLTITAEDYNYVKLYNLSFTLYDATGETPILENVTAEEWTNKYVFNIKGTLDPAGYLLKAEAPYYEPYSQQVMTNSTSSRDITFKEGQSTTGKAYFRSLKVNLTVTVLNDDQEYVTNAIVTLLVGDNEGSYLLRNQQNGTYTYTDLNAATLADKTCKVTCTVPDMKPVADEEVVFNGESKEVTITAFKWQPTTVSGTVTGKDGALANATVTLYAGEEAIIDATTTTDAEGKYTLTFPGEVPEELSVKATAEYYDEATKAITEIEREGMATADLTLNPVMYTFTATVANEAEEAIADATVTMGNEVIVRDENGNYVTEIWAGDAANGAEFTATAAATGYESEEYTFSFAEGATAVTKDFRLKAIVYSYTATVTDAEGKALADASVVITTAGGETLDVTKNENGEYVYTTDYWNLPEGDLTCTVSCKYYVSQTSTFNFTEEEVIAETFALEEQTYKFTLTVYDYKDALITNADVTILSGADFSEKAANMNDGTYEFVASAADADGVTYTVEIIADGCQSKTATFNFAEGDATLTVKLDKEEGVMSILADQQGAVNADGRIYVNGEAYIFTLDGKLVRKVRTQGVEEVTGLAPGIYLVAGQKMIVK